MSIRAPLFFFLAVLAWYGAGRTARADEWGAGANIVSQYVFRDSLVSGPSVQPSAYLYVPGAHLVATAWSSVRLADPRLDDISLDARAGVPLASWGWVGASLRWAWDTPGDTTRRMSLEPGVLFTWFAPPYRPNISVSYAFGRGEGLLTALSVPYTLRLGWLPPTTFIPEIAIRFGRNRSSGWRAGYSSFTMLMERRIGHVAIVPMAGVVPKGGVRSWIVWGGLHVGASR